MFEALYLRPCLEAFLTMYAQDTAAFLTREVQKCLRQHFEFLEAGKSSAAELHATNIRARSATWAKMISYSTCLVCLSRPPQHSLPCGHSLCDTCASTFGTPSLGAEYTFELSSCFFCNRDVEFTAKVKPPTSGVRILSIDGGGTRGVVPLEFLRLLQGVLGKECPIQDFFDIAAGTSSGELSESRCCNPKTSQER